MRGLLLFILMVSADVAQARVFNINRPSVAPYFMISGGGSQLGTSAIDDEGVSGATRTGTVGYNYSTEFGALISNPNASLKFGLEVAKPTILNSDVSSGSSVLYSATSEILAYIPKVGVELNLQRADIFRSFLALSVGYGTLSLKNSYVLTAAGTSAYSGVSNHSVEAKSTATQASAAMGYEGWMDDNTTILFQFGYQQMKFTNITYSKDVTTFSGAKTQGSKLLTSAGVDKSLDMSGAFVEIGFRFYF